MIACATLPSALSGRSLGEGRSLGASNIEKATVNVKKDVRGAAGETKAETATRDAGVVAAAAVASALSASAASKSPFASGDLTTAPFPVASTPTTVTAPASDHSTLNTQPSTPASSKRVFSAEEKRVCSIEAMKNGEECEACQ